MKYQVCWFLVQPLGLAFPSLAVKMSLYLLVQGRYFHVEIYFQLQGEQKKGSVCFLHQLFLKSLYFRAISVLQWSVLG